MNTKIQAVINELAHQRNQNADAVAMLSGEIAERDEKIAVLQKELYLLKAEPVPAVEPVTATPAA
ncbi:MAG: hypothetical protein ACREUF_08460 [Solimonas sp.]